MLRGNVETARLVLGVSLAMLVLGMTPAMLLVGSSAARAQTVEDGSDAAIGPADARTVLDLVGRHLKSPDAKVTELRRRAPTLVCGSVNVKNRDGLYTGERGFVVDLADASFGRVPDGVEMLAGPRTVGYEAMERIRRLYFDKCLD